MTMVTAHEPIPVDTPSTVEPAVILTMPAGAWLALTDLASGSASDPTTRRRLRPITESVTQVDTIITAAVLVRDGEVEGVSAHVHQGDAERALTVWLRQQPELWEGITLDDWHHLREAGLVPEGLAESTIMMLPVDASRATGGGHR